MGVEGQKAQTAVLEKQVSEQANEVSLKQVRTRADVIDCGPTTSDRACPSSAF